MFSTITIESSTSIQITKIRANKEILFISYQTMYEYKNTSESIKGIEVAVFNAFFHQRNKIKITTTIIIDSIKSFTRASVAFFASTHSS